MPDHIGPDELAAMADDEEFGARLGESVGLSLTLTPFGRALLSEPATPSREEIEDQLCAALDRADDLEALVRWLALPYLTTSVDGQPTVKTPIFATKNILTGEDLITGPKLEAIWKELFGDGEPPAPGRWVRCESCNAYNIESVSYEGSVPLTEEERARGLDLLRRGFL